MQRQLFWQSLCAKVGFRAMELEGSLLEQSRMNRSECCNVVQIDSGWFGSVAGEENLPHRKGRETCPHDAPPL